jgi:glutaredoxin
MPKKPPDADAKIIIVYDRSLDLNFKQIISKDQIDKVYETVKVVNAKVYNLYPAYAHREQIAAVKDAFGTSTDEAAKIFKQVDTIMKKANDKRVVLRKLVMHKNPYLSYRERFQYSFEASVLEPFEAWYESHAIGARICLVFTYIAMFFFTFFVWFVLLFTVLFNLVTCKYCRKTERSKEEVEWILDKFRHNPSFDSYDVDKEVRSDLSELCKRLSQDFKKPVTLWTGVEHVSATEDNDSYDLNEYIILINSKDKDKAAVAQMTGIELIV